MINRNRLGRDFFARGCPERVETESIPVYSATLYDLLTAYASSRQRNAITNVTIARRTVWSLQDARAILSRFIGKVDDWAPIDRFLIAYIDDPKMRRTALASAFAASLEMAREGMLQLRQSEAYSPLYIRFSSQAAAKQAH